MYNYLNTKTAFHSYTNINCLFLGKSSLCVGADASLCLGPQKSLLSDEYEDYSGPDPANRVGPNKDIRLYERTAAVGPSAENRHGPNPEFYKGPQGTVEE